MISHVPSALGADRVEPGPGGTVVLSSRAPKGWVARSPATRTSAEHPGTCVVWEDGDWEVLDVDEEPGGGVRYVLGPWDERHAIRVRTRYDAGTEASRTRGVEEAKRRTDVRLGILLAAPLLGLAPTAVQEGWEREYGVPTARLTLISLVAPFVLGVLSLFALLFRAIGAVYAAGAGERILPGSILLQLFGVYLLVESLTRFGIAASSGRGCGSLLGTLPFLVVSVVTGKARPVATLADAETARSHALRDAYLLREVLIGFLSPADQRVAAERFGFDPIRWGRTTAVGTLVLMSAQVLLSLDALKGGQGSGHVPPLLLATGLVVEQLFRLRRLGRGQPAGSVLRFLFRPLCRKLLA